MRRRTLLAAAGLGAAAGCAPSRAAPPVPAVSTGGPVSTGNGVVVAPVRQAAATDLHTTLSTLEQALTGSAATIGVGASLFDGRFPGPAKPRLLTDMPAFRADVLDPQWCHGDLLVQVVGDDAAALRRLARAPVAGLRRRWQMEGFHPAGLGQGVRNLFGFREGAGNPDAADRDLMSRLVWVQPDDGEPAWCTGGTYQVVRLIRMALPTWDSDPVADQERVIGRRRDNGAPLSGDRRDDEPDLAGDRIAVDAHIRLANPRTPEAMAHRILRRGYSYRLPAVVSGVDDAGQIFICYQRDVELGFATIQRRLAGEAMEKYLLPFGGGYYFVLPPAGVRALIG
jgi:deferrochelatase/peroxidase EfeB